MIYYARVRAPIIAYRQSIWMICQSFYWVRPRLFMIRREASFSDGKLLIIIDNIFICIIKAITIIHYYDSFSYAFTATIPKCGGCHEFILDRFILKVSDRTWHAKCLQCNDCHAQLNEKCFIRNGQLFCKDDFFKWVVKRFNDIVESFFQFTISIRIEMLKSHVVSTFSSNFTGLTDATVRNVHRVISAFRLRKWCGALRRTFITCNALPARCARDNSTPATSFIWWRIESLFASQIMRRQRQKVSWRFHCRLIGLKFIILM